MNSYLCLLINTFLYIPGQGIGTQRGPGYTMFLGISFMASVHRASYACALFYNVTHGCLTLCSLGSDSRSAHLKYAQKEQQ